MEWKEDDGSYGFLIGLHEPISIELTQWIHKYSLSFVKDNRVLFLPFFSYTALKTQAAPDLPWKGFVHVALK